MRRSDMQSVSLFSSMLALSLSFAAPTVFAHVGHGDEFQATGGVNQVAVNQSIDALLGIQVAPIEATAATGEAILIPVTALVNDNDRQLVFVQYENFYEPVDVVTGETQGELIEIIEGLSVGEQLVTQGSLSLYAESRKTQTAQAQSAETETATETTAGTTTAAEPAQVTATESATDTASSGSPIQPVGSSGISAPVIGGVIAGVVAIVIAGVAVAITRNRDKKDLS